MGRITALCAALLTALLATALAAPAGASVQVGASGWQWGNPLPQGNTLRGMAFAGTTGYAAGDFGTLLKTTDGGATWSGLPVGTFAGLTVVQVLDADVVLAGGGCVARRSVDGGRSFTAVGFTPVEAGCRAPLRDLAFVTRDTGYVLLADGSLYVTTDGGTHFTPRTAVPGTRATGSGSAEPGAIAFLDASKGYATSGGQLFQTLDGGNAWRLIPSPGNAIRALWFATPDRGFAVGAGGLLLRTDDGGTTWTSKPLGVADDFTSIRCAGGQLCVLTTAAGTHLVRTTDAGDTAGTVVTPSSAPILAAAFASPTRVAAAGQNGATVISDDAGVTFAQIGGRIGGTFTGLRAGGAANSAFAAGAGGALAKTVDGGRTWSTGNVPTSADLIDVSFPSTTVGYALDGDGGLFGTDNAGGAWKPLGTGSTRRARAVLAPDTSVVLVVGPIGMRRSADGGETFDQVRVRGVLGARLDGAARAGSAAILAWGPSTVLRSTDRGRTWSALPKPGRTARERRGLRIAQVAFSSANAGLLRDTAGRVWRTTNAGRRWALLTSVGTERVSGIATASARTAYVVVDAFGDRTGGFLLRSGDGGATWQPQFVVDAAIRSGGVATASGVDYLLAGDASLLFSTSGGVAGSPSELTVTTRSRRLASARRITVTGRLQPAAGGAQVVVSAQLPGSTHWTHQTVGVAANGTFASAWRVRRGTTTFVAQWAGDFESAGAGSRPMTVTVAAGGRAHRR